jgi:hypothetical protein
LGRRRTAPESGGHGGDLGRAWEEKQRRERKLAGEEKRREGTSWLRAVSPGVSSTLRRKQEVVHDVQGASTQVLDLVEVEDKVEFAQHPLGFGGFLGIYRIAPILHDLVIQNLFRKL